MRQPMGRLETLHFRQATFYAGNGKVGKSDVLRVHFRAPDGDYYTQDLPNGHWTIDNKALQFLAKWGYRPSDIGDRDSTMRDCHDDQILVPIAPVDPEADEWEWGLAQSAMKDARAALDEAEWFASDDDEESTDDRPDGPQSGPGPDPGTGNRAGVEEPSDPEEPSGVTVEKASEDSDSGVTVTVE